MHEIALYGSVGDSFWEEESFTPSEVREMLAGLSGPLTVRLNSGGGIATDGKAIHALLTDYPGEVTVVVDGIAASAASLIAMAGDRIVMRDGALMMIHDPAQWFTEGRGTEDDHLAAARVLRVMASAYAGLYAKRAGMTADEARAIMKAETWLDPAAAIEMGFADDAGDGIVAATAAQFDYRLYARAPEHLLANGVPEARRKPKPAVMAMLAGHPAPTSPMKGAPAMADKLTAAQAAENEPDLETEEEMAEDQDKVLAEDHGDDEMAEDQDGTMADGEDEPVAEDDDKAMAKAGPIAAQIIDLTARYGQPPEVAQSILARGLSLPRAIAHLQKLTAEDNPMTMKAAHGQRAKILRDERDTRRAGISAALTARLTRSDPTDDRARPFMDMTMVQMGLALTGQTAPLLSFGQRETAFRMAITHSQSDFPAILEDALNKVLLDAYDFAAPTFRQVGTQITFNDLRPTPLVRTGDFPTLLPVTENGELQHGTFNEGKETALIGSYGRQISVSRAMLINDDLGAIERTISAYGPMIARFMETTAYTAWLTGVLSDGKAVYHADHGNLAGAGAAISVASLSAGEKAIMDQKSIDGEDLGLHPSILLTGTAKRTEARQVVMQTTPTKASDVNPFSGDLTVITTPKVPGNNWYLLVSPDNPACNHVYGFLDGAEAPRVRVDEPFGKQGMAVSIELDFGAGNADHRGGYKNTGA